MSQKLFSLIYEGEIHLNEDDKILPKNAYSKILSAQEVLAKVKEEAKKYSETNVEECEALAEKAKAEGHQEGLITFNEHILKMEEELRILKHNVQGQIIPLALQAAKKIVGTVIDKHPDVVVDIVMQVLKPVTQNKNIKLIVNKEEKDLLESNKEKFKALFEQVESFSIEEREGITKGSCIIETEAGIINATLENQWQALEAALEALKRRQDYR